LPGVREAPMTATLPGSKNALRLLAPFSSIMVTDRSQAPFP
jgi:hypothetical protein